MKVDSNVFWHLFVYNGLTIIQKKINDSREVKLPIKSTLSDAKDYDIKYIRTVNDLNLPLKFLDVDLIKRQ